MQLFAVIASANDVGVMSRQLGIRVRVQVRRDIDTNTRCAAKPGGADGALVWMRTCPTREHRPTPTITARG